MTYSEFEWKLCNEVFTMAMFYPEQNEEGKRYLYIQNWNDTAVYIFCVETENSTLVRVSFNHNGWKLYGSYEDALKGICNQF